jgi:hypothetical protein
LELAEYSCHQSKIDSRELGQQQGEVAVALDFEALQPLLELEAEVDLHVC